MVEITALQLRRLAPFAKQGVITALAEHAPYIFPQYRIITPLRVAHFMAQIAHESSGFRSLEENLNYSANGLLKTFRKYFHTYEHAAQYARNPEKIANLVYANRIGNGLKASGDGWKFRGRGLIQLTGKGNYIEYGSRIGIDLTSHPQRAADPRIALLLACEYWQSHKINTPADRNDIRAITRAINGGTNGINDRKRKFSKAWTIWGEPARQRWFGTMPLLRRGMTGPAVKTLQRKLELIADGIFGPGTERAVKAYQRHNGLRTDGIVGPATWRRISS